jgi:hypothetical protein
MTYHIKNEKIGEELGVKSVLTQIRQYEEKWGEHLQRMEKILSSPKNSMGISTNRKKKPGKAKNAVDY